MCRNPVGRTGMVGRGLLGRWGPNHAADPIVTRYVFIIRYVIVVSQAGVGYHYYMRPRAKPEVEC